MEKGNSVDNSSDYKLKKQMKIMNEIKYKTK